MIKKLSLSTALVVTSLFIAGAALAVHVTTRSASSSRAAAAPEAATASAPAAPGPVTVHAAGRGKPFFNFADGRQMTLTFRGRNEASAALQSGEATPRALASADLDGNGTPDVVSGYTYGGTGIVTIQRGNPDAYAPADDSVFVRIQQGYKPTSLLPETEVYPVPVPADFVAIGNFTRGASKDILIAAKGGGLYVMAGQGKSFGPAEQISLSGPVTAMAAGEFRAADGVTDVAVSVTGPGGDALLIFDGAEGLTSPLASFPLAGPATGIEFGSLDDDPFLDIAVAAGSEIGVVHGWGRKTAAKESAQFERVSVGSNLRGLALGEFSWDRQGRTEIAVLTGDGNIQIVQHAQLDTRAFTEAEKAKRTRTNLSGTRLSQDVESISGWPAIGAAGWTLSKSFAGGAVNPAALKPLMKTHISHREMDEIALLGQGDTTLKILRPLGPDDLTPDKELLVGSDLVQVSLDVTSDPIAMLPLTRKLFGEQDVMLLSSGPNALSIVPNAPNTTITVDRTDDPAVTTSGTGAAACTAAGSDCSLRGAVLFSNHPSNNNTTISLPANTYILSINGTSVGGCSDTTNGDLGANQTMSIVGAGAATTIIRQTGTGPANDGDRIMCMNEVFAIGLTYNFSGVTFTGGRDGAAGGGPQVIGGGGIVGGELNNSLTLTSVVFVNNWTVGPGLGGGGIQITGGNLTITNSTFGGTNAPGLYTDRSSVTNANQTGTSGAGVNFTPSSPMHAGGTGILTVTGTTFSRNVANSVSAGGGGADLYIFAFASPGGIGSGNASFGTTTFNNNSAPTANGGAFITESLPTTVATTSFTSNSSGNRGGAIYVGGGGLTLNGTSPSITFTGNTATNAGSSVSTAFTVNVDGTNTSIGGDIEVGQGGTWTNNTGSTLAPTNVVVAGGVFVMNNSTMNVSGNLTIGPGGTNGGTFNGNTGTVNIQGNFILNAGGVGPATNLAAGTGTFNFNGTGAQSITNGTAITFFNLTDSNVTQPLTANNSFGVNGTLNVNGANAIFSPVAAAVISGTGTLTGTGTARASRITAGTADFLNQYTISNKTLTNLQIDYNGAGNQTVNNTPAYSRLVISGSGIKTLQGNTAVSGNLTIAAANLSGSTFNLGLGGNWTNSVGAGGFTPGTGTVTFQGTTGIQTITGNTTFFNLTLNNAGATTNFSNTTATVGNDLTASAGTMDGGTSTIVFTGVTDNAGAILGAAAKNFHNLQINSPATISNTAGAAITIEGNYSNAGTFSQAAGQTTIFDVDNAADGAHTLAGAGTTTFGVFTINASNAVDAGSHNFNVIGAVFTSTGTFTGNTSTVTFNGAGAQGIAGDGVKNFSGLTINNANAVTVINGAGAVDASVGGVLTLTTDLTVSSTGPAILQQSGTSAGAGDVLGTVRRADLGVTPRSFGNLNNQVTVNSGTPPTQLDFNLVKATPTGFPATVKVVPRTYTLTPTGGAGISATLRLRYLDNATEITTPGITESRLVLWKDTTGTDNWVAQGGTVDTAGNFVTHTGISSFSEWAIAEGSDLTLSKANNVGGSAVVGQSWNWTLTAANTGAPATFTAGQTILSDNLPNANLIYGTPTVQNVSNITGSANISCSIVSNDLTCTASGGSVTFDSNLGASSFEVVFSATPQAVGLYQNPRTGGGIAQIDPNNIHAESNETNNSPANNTVTVGKANTTTVINSDNPDPSVVGQPVTVTWSVTVNAPGAVGAPLTGNVTVSDGTNQCVAAVSAGQCDITFTSSGAKSLTATYAGDTNYNGSASTPATPHTVNAANTTTTITSDNPDPSTPGQSVTVQWTVTVDSPGAGTPTGTVTVTVSGGAETCNAPVATGQCNLVLNTTGLRTITATYPGDLNFNTSNDTEDHTVCGDPIVTTTADSGAGSLRKAITDACDGATITFNIAGAGPHTITLTTGEIAVAKSITINNNSGERITVTNATGRAFNINAAKTVAIIGLTITGNVTGDGGAIINDGDLTIVNSTLTGSTATADGGAISTTATGTSLSLINTTLSGNTAAGSGGGLITLGGTVSIINTTITNNTADSDNNSAGGGGGLRAHAGTVTLKNTIVAGNINEDGASDAADDISGTVDAASSFNLIGDATTSGGLTHGVNGNIVGNAGAGTIVTSTVIGALADNGGLTNTHALVSSGPAVETGSNANVPVDTFDLDGDANMAETLPVDQRGLGFPRTADSADANIIQTVDIGAFELHPSIENIPNDSTNEDTVKNITFNLGDDTGSLIATVAATSSNTTLVPNANLVITGSGGSRNLQITPAAGQSGTTTITVTVTATNGRTATDTFDLTVNAVNDPPSGTDNTVSTTEDTAYTFTAADFGFTDPNDTPPNTFLAVKITTLPALGTLTNNNVPVNAGDFIPVADINGGLLKFTPAADGFGTPYTTFTFQVQDNGGGTDLDPTPNTMTINVTGVNDGPVNTVPGPQNTDEDVALVFSSGNGNQISVSDVDAGANPVKITLTATNGTITLSTTAGLSFITGDGTADATMMFTGTLTAVNTALNGMSFTGTANFSGAASLQIVSDDQGNTGTGGPLTDTDSVNITINAVNDPPSGTNNTVSTAEDIAYTFTAADFGFTDPNDTPPNTLLAVKITTLPALGTLTNNNVPVNAGDFIPVASINGGLLKFTPAADGNGTPYTTFTFQVQDNGGGTDLDPTPNTMTINVTAVNDGPTNTVPGPQSTNEDTALVFSAGNANLISVADVDAGANPVKITLTATNGTITLSTTAGLSFTTGDGTADATMTFTGTLTAVNTALNGMSFNPTPDFNGAASLQIVSDDQGNTGSGGPLTDTDTVNITVNAQNDAPVVTTTAGNLAYTENAAATAIDPTLTVTDVDNPNLVGATVAITSGFVAAQDTLGFTNQNGITGNYNGGTGVLTLTGSSSVANYQTALRSVTYVNSSDNPTASRTVTFIADDGSSTSSPATRGITINAVNDAPVNTVPGPQGTASNTPIVFSSGNGNQISVADVDAGTNVIQVTLTATNGTVTLSGTSGLAFSVGDGTADATMTFTGTIANINTALNGMTFTPTAGFSGAATLTITSNDLGNTGSGGAQSDTDVVNIQVSTDMKINDAKVPEPTSGTTTMLFTVTLNAPAPAGGVSVNYTTQDEPAGPGKAVAGFCLSGGDYVAASGPLNFAVGEQFKTISVTVCSDGTAEPDETFRVLLSGEVNATLIDGLGIGTITAANSPGAVLISELRTSGPGGAGDDFVEVYNNSDSPLTVAASDASAGYGLYKMGASCGDVPVLIGVIPNGTVIPARGHFLFVGSAYSLTASAAGNQTMGSDIESDRNVGLFSTSTLANIGTANRLDAAGFGANTGSLCDLMREGTNLTATAGSTTEHSYFRKQCDWQFGVGCTVPGIPKDSNDNQADFWLADTAGTGFPSAVFGVPPSQRLGAPGPENLASPLRRDTSGLSTFFIDTTQVGSAQPNRARDTTPNVCNGGVAPSNCTFGTMTIRRRVSNTTGAAVTRLRFRVVDLSTFPAASGAADVRALTGGNETVGSVNDPTTCTASGAGAPPCTVTVLGTTLETPPGQPNGGGYNSTLSSGTITLGTPLANGASINVNFVLGVQQTGTFRFLIIVEALP